MFALVHETLKNIIFYVWHDCHEEVNRHDFSHAVDVGYSHAHDVGYPLPTK